MPETPVLVVVEIISVQDPAGLRNYAGRAGALIGTYGGTVIGQGGAPIDGEPSFAPLVIQHWKSEAAFRVWLDSEDYRSLKDIRLASAKMRASIVPFTTGPDVV